ncbi:MAG: hypothetical protein JXB42_13435 [Deltaproteobacteria bacterium]|nr:hypothetical protein [Deltaproteobacteria bacterium]
MAFDRQTELVDMEGKKHKITPVPATYKGLITASLIYNFYDYYDRSFKLKALIKNDSPEYL